MRVGFIGLGAMGGGMAANLQAAGHDLVLCDPNPEALKPLVSKGADARPTPAEVAADVEVLFTSLPGPREVELVALGSDGVLAGARSGLAHFDLSTNAPVMVRKVAEAAAEKGVKFLDAPVSGGPKGARSGRLALWVSGDRDAFERNRQALAGFADQVSYIGPAGTATVAKLVHNLSSYSINAVLAECFTLGAKAGLDPLDLWKALRAGAVGRRRTYDGLADQFLKNAFDTPAFALELAHKDVRLAVELGREVGVPLRMASLTLAEMTEALNRGWGKRDSRSFMLLQEERAGVEIAVPAERLSEELAKT